MMKIYFAGDAYDDILAGCGVKNVLKSAYYLDYKKSLKELKSRFPSLLLDSGGFTARTRGVKVSVSQYANYINQEGLDLVFELDTSDPDETKANRDYLKSHVNAYVIPIYHYSDFCHPRYRGLLDEFVENYEYIAIGGVEGVDLGKEAEITLYKYVFNRTKDKIKVHGLGITDTRVLKAYPFYSVDSTSWFAPCRYGKKNTRYGKRDSLKPVDFGYKKNQSGIRQALKDKSNSRLKSVRAAIPEIKVMLTQEKQITELWERKGVVWQ